MKRHYEIVLLIHPDCSEQVADMVQRYREIIDADGGTIHRYEDWGRRQLAYPINNNKVRKAHYILLNIECSIPVLAELKDLFRYNDAIIRELVLIKDKAITEPSPMVAVESSSGYKHEKRDYVRKTQQAKIDQD